MYKKLNCHKETFLLLILLFLLIKSYDPFEACKKNFSIKDEGNEIKGKGLFFPGAIFLDYRMYKILTCEKTPCFFKMRIDANMNVLMINRVYCDSGDEFIVALQFGVTHMWKSKFGLILERQVE